MLVSPTHIVKNETTLTTEIAPIQTCRTPTGSKAQVVFGRNSGREDELLYKQTE